MLSFAATPGAPAGTCVAVPMGINACPTWVGIYDYSSSENTSADSDGAFAEALSPAGDRVFVTVTSGDPTATYNGSAGGSNIATVAYDTASGAQLWVARYTGAGHHQDFPTAITLSPDGTRAFVTGVQNMDVLDAYELVGDYVTIAYDTATGAQLWVADYQAPGPYPTLCCGLSHNQYSEALSVAVSPDGSRVAVTGFSGQSPSDGFDVAFATVVYDADNGNQLWSQRYDDPTNGFSSGHGVIFSPTGSLLYATGTGAINTQANHSEFRAFAYDAATGAAVWSTGNDFGNQNHNYGDLFALSHDGRRLYIGGQEDVQLGTPETSNFGIIAIDAETGAELWSSTYAGPMAGINRPIAMALSPTGDRLFLTGGDQYQLATSTLDTVAFDAASGQQAWSATFMSGDTFDEAIGMAITPDGSRVFVTGQAGASVLGGRGDIVTIGYDTKTGNQVWAARYNSSATLTDTDFPSSVVILPDETGLIVTGTFATPGSMNVFLYEAGTMRYDLIPPPPVQLTGVVSRKSHADAGTFDVDLTSGNGIECRSGGDNGDYTMVFTFANTLANVGGASVTSGTGSIASSNIDSNDAHNYVVNLTGVTTAQQLAVNLANVTDSLGNFSSAVSASMGVLVGDVNGSRRVDAADVSSVRQQTLQTIDFANFRNDLDASGRIDAADVSIARQQALTSLP
jgi:hypothetical protein